MPKLKNVHVLVAGAGLAGLAAARALEADGASVTVVEARNRVGGRVWTIRDGFAGRQHAEGGGDFIESSQKALVALAHELKLPLVKAIDRGFGYYGPDRHGRLQVQSMALLFQSLEHELAPLVRAYRLAEQRWTSVIAQTLATKSVADWLEEIRASAWVRHRVRGFRGLFLADPADLSLLALVDFLADFEGDEEDDDPGWSDTYRLAGGNDLIAKTMARRLRTRVKLETVLRQIRQTDTKIVAALEERSRRAEITADYAIVTLPATTARDVVFDPDLPTPQRQALTTLRYGASTRLLLQFSRRFWTKAGRPTAFGSDQPIGALWDANQHERGPAAILSFLAGGGASREIQQILSAEGVEGIVDRVRWLGRPERVLASRSIVWEDDPWARGGYAFFDPAFDPALRDWLGRAHGRVLFAGEHTSFRFQGYMNGAVETGQRAAAEIAALHHK